MLICIFTAVLTGAAPVEVVGAEYMPGWLRTESATDLSLRANAVTGAGVLRLGTLNWGRFVWTAGLVGYGLADRGARPTRFFLLATEPGVRLYQSDRHTLSLGLGVGLGVFAYARGSRGQQRDADIGLSWSPSLRYSYRAGRNFAFGFGLRAFTRTPGDNFPVDYSARLFTPAGRSNVRASLPGDVSDWKLSPWS